LDWVSRVRCVGRFACFIRYLYQSFNFSCAATSNA